MVVNEKVAAEGAIGASMAGARAMAAMKHFGMNVASDAVFPSVYIEPPAAWCMSAPTIPA